MSNWSLNSVLGADVELALRYRKLVTVGGRAETGGREDLHVDYSGSSSWAPRFVDWIRSGN